MLKELQQFNADPNILYMAKLRQRADAERINQKITESVEKLGFERRSNDEYIYRGSDPATALRGLLKVRPLVLDCATALHLLTYQGLLESLGNAQFNSYIKDACKGDLSIDKQKAPPVPSDRTAYYSARHEQNENPLPADLRHGDRLWIQGPAHGYAFHPTSEANGFNVLTDMSTPDNPSLVGFVSAASATHGAWSYDGLRSLLLESYNKPLTLRDLAFLHTRHQQGSQELAPYSAWSFHQAYEWLKEAQPQAMAQALQQLNNPKVDLDQPTAIYPPQANAIRGVAQHSKTRESLSLQALIDYPDNLATVALNPAIPPDTQFGNLIQGFETRLPHQQQIHVAMDEFYRACKDSNSPPFQGTILYGNAGTGKTMASTAVLRRLAEEGHTAWKTNFSEGEDETLLNADESQQLLTVLQTKGSDAFYAALTKKFKPAWDKADILFIDDTNNKHDTLASVSTAALRYARENGKKILLTCNSDPIHAFHSSIEFPIDSISIRHIAGADYRAEKAWHRNVSSAGYPVPEKIDDMAATENQKKIVQWLQALQDHPGHNGVAFYGAPGMGKTTALKAWCSEQAFKTFWIESHTLIDHVDLVKELASSEAEYLVIDDCNDPKGNSKYQGVLFALLNNEALFNKHGQPVRAVMVSNRSSWQELVNDTASGKSPLSPRMNSRYAGRFMSVELAPDQDFRATGAKRGVIAKIDAVSVSEKAHRLSISQYLEGLTAKRSTLLKYYAMRKNPDGTENNLSPADLAAYDAANLSFDQHKISARQDIESCEEIFLDMSGCKKEKWSYDYTALIQQVLDVMDAKPEYKVTIASDDPAQTMEVLQHMMEGVDQTGKYTSRLQRFGCE